MSSRQSLPADGTKKDLKKIRPDCYAVDSDFGGYTRWVRSRAPTRKKRERKKRAHQLKEEAGGHEQPTNPSSRGDKEKENDLKKTRPDCYAVNSDLGDYTQWVRSRAPIEKKKKEERDATDRLKEEAGCHEQPANPSSRWDKEKEGSQEDPTRLLCR